VTAAEQAGAHPDAVQSFCNGNSSKNEAVNFLLVEGLTVFNMRGSDSHGILINSTQDCGGSSTVIARESSFFQIGSGIYYGDDNAAFGDHHKAYNNTIVDSGLDSPGHVAMTFSGIDAAGVFNNIFVDAIGETPPFSGYALKPNSNSIGDHDLAFMSSGPKSWGGPVGTEPNAVLDQDPSFVDQATGNLALQAGSPAIDKGGALTLVTASDSGSGTTLQVDDAHYFQPGWAGTEGDWIAVGSVDNVAQIGAIDYAANTITLTSAVARSSGDSVWLYKNSSGSVVLIGTAPDIGAFEFGAAPDGGATDGGATDGGATDGGVADGGVPDGGAPDGGATDAGGSGGHASDQSTDGGCGCRTSRPREPNVYVLFGLLVLVALRRRRFASGDPGSRRNPGIRCTSRDRSGTDR
jgi:MYXO-CTERM domain-containing protein